MDNDPAQSSLESNLETPSTYRSSTGRASFAPPQKRFQLLRFNRTALIFITITIAIMIILGASGLLLSKKASKSGSPTSDNMAANYLVSDLSLQGLNGTGQLELGKAQSLTINGQLRVNGSLYLQPSDAPKTGQIGQLYFDKTTNQPYYYNGTDFVGLAPKSVTIPSSVSSINGRTGAIDLGNGLQLLNGTLQLSADVLQATTAVAGSANVVSSVQGQTGAVSFSAGNGIAINGTTITNTGLLSVGGATGDLALGRGLSIQAGAIRSTVSLSTTSTNLVIADDGNGNYTINDTAFGSGSQLTLAPLTAQTDSTNRSSIRVDKTNSAGNFMQFSSAGVDRFVVTQSGAITVGTIDYSQVTNAPPPGVTSIGGVGGAIGLGTGLGVSGSTLTNTGVTSISGTSNQVIVSGSTGNVVVSLPQDLAVSSSPTFVGLGLTGNLTVAGTSAVTGNASVGGTSTIGSDQRVGGNSTITGNSTVSGSSSITNGLNVGGTSSLAGNLNVGGTTTLNSNVSVTGTNTFTTGSGAVGLGGTLAVTGNSNLLGTLNVANATTLSSSLAVIGNTTLSGTLSVIGANTFTGLGTFNGGLTIANNSSFSQTGTGSFSTGTGSATFNGNTTVTGANTFTVGSGTTTLGGVLNVTGLATLANNLTVQGGNVTIGTTGTQGRINLANASGRLVTIEALGPGGASGNATIQFPSVNGGGSDQVCLLNLANCAGAGTGVTASASSAGYIPVFDAAQHITNSSIYQSGSSVGINTTAPGAYALNVQGGNVNFAGNVVANSGIAVTGTSIFNGSTSVTGANNFTVGSGTTTLGGALNANGNATFTADITQTGAGMFTTGSGAISLNGATSITGSNAFNVGSGATTLGGSLTTAGGTTLSGDVNIGSTNQFQVAGSTGNLTTSGTINGQTIGSNSIFSGGVTIQGSNGLALGVAGSTNGNLTFANSTSTKTVSLQALNPSYGGNVNLTIPSVSTATDEICLKVAANCAGSGGGITGTGTANYVTKYGPSGATIVNASLYDDGTFVGVNTTTNSGKVSVVSSGTQTGLYVQGAATGASAVVAFRSGGGSGDLLQLQNSGGTVLSRIDSGGSITGVNGTLTGGLSVAGASTFAGNVAVSGVSSLTVGTGATTLGGTLGVTGATTLSGAVTVANSFSVSSGTGIVGSFSGRVTGGNAVASNEFVTLGQVTSLGAGSYITNGTTPQTADFNVTGNGTVGNLTVTTGAAIGGTLTVASGITVSSFGVGIVQSNASGVLSSSAVSRNDTNYFNTTLSVGNGGTGATTLAANGLLYGNGTGAIQATTAAANSILATSGTNVPGLTQTLPTAVQGNITSTGALAAGSIATGFGNISTANIIATTGTLQGGTVNSTSGFQLNGTNINTAGTLSNVAYLNQANVFSAAQTINGTLAVNAGAGIVGTFSGRVSGANAVSTNEFATLGQITALGASSYIANSTAVQSNANFNIQALTSGTAGTIGGIIRGAAGGQTADLYQFQNSAGVVVSKVDANGNLAVDLQNGVGTGQLFGTNGSTQVVSIGGLIPPATLLANLLTTPTTTSATPAGTTGSTSYSYKIVAMTGTGLLSAPSNAVSTATGNAVLSSLNKINIAWSAVTGATSYFVYRTVANGSSPTSIGYIGATTGTALADTGFVASKATPVASSLANTTYFYKITALDGQNAETTASNETSLATGATAQAVSLSWVATPGARTYRIYRGTSSGVENSYQTSTTSSFTDYGSSSTLGSVPLVSTASAINLSSGTNAQLSVGSAGTPTGQLYVGGIVAGPISVTQGGTAGIMNVVYQIVGVDLAGNLLPPPYGVGYTNTSNSALTATNYNQLTWASISGAASYNVYHVNSSGSAFVGGLIGNTTTTTLQDIGQSASGSIPSSTLGVLNVSSIGTSSVVNGKYLYASSGLANTAFTILDTTSRSTPVFVSSANGTNSNVIAAQGKYVYTVNTAANAFQIFDVSNASLPALVSTTSVISLASANPAPVNIMVSGRYVYITNRASTVGFEIFDVANPTSPHLVGSTFFSQPGQPGGTIIGKYAYIGSANGCIINVVDISDPTNPTLASATPCAGGGNSGFGASGQGKYLYLTAPAGLLIYDITNPVTPILVSNTNALAYGANSSIQVQGRYVFVTTSNGNPGNIDSLEVFDVSNPASPNLVSANAISHGNGQHSINVSGRTAYVINDNSNLETYDLGGTYSQAIEAGTAEVTTLSVQSNASILSSLTVGGALSVAGNTQFSGSVGISGTFALQGAAQLGGGILGGVGISAISTPSAPTVIPSGTIGTSSYSYAVAAVSASGVITPASFAGTTASGNAILNLTNFNLISWPASSGAVSYNIYRTASGGIPSGTGLIGNTNSTSLNDTGLAASGTTPSVFTGSLLSVGTLTTSDTTSQATISTSNAGNKGLVIQGTAGQTADLLQLQNSTGTVLTKVDANGNLTTFGAIFNGNINLNQTAAPATAPTFNAFVAAGTLTGSYYYVYSYVTASGETEYSPVSAVIAPTAQNVTINIANSPSNLVTSRNIYRGTTSSGPFNLVGSVANNTATTFTDSTTSPTTTASNMNSTASLKVNGATVLNVSAAQGNTFVGLQAGIGNTTGNNNTASGGYALSSNTTGNYNTASGNSSLLYNTTGSNNAASGYAVLRYLVTSTNTISATATNAGNAQFTTVNTSGLVAGASITITGTTSYNGARTVLSVDSPTTFTISTAFSTADATGTWTTASTDNNTALGYQAGIGSSNGYAAVGGTYVGANTGFSLQTGANYNTLLGYSAGSNLTTGANNIIIGQNAQATSATGSNQLSIGNVIYGDLLNKQIVLPGASAGGYNAANATLKVGRDTTTLRSINAAGSINASGADYAEYIPWTGTKPPTGSIVSYQGSNYVVSSIDTAAFIGNDAIADDNKILVTFAGQVPVLVTGIVNVGDILISNGDGTAKAITPGNASIGQLLAKIAIAQEANTISAAKLVKASIGTTSDSVASALQNQSGDFANVNVQGTAKLNNVAISGTTSIANLNVSGATVLTNLTVTGDTTITGRLTVTSIAVTDITVSGHIITAGGQPVATPALAAGDKATVTVSGTDTTGTITITIGSNPVAGAVAKITFSKAYGTAPRVVLSPSNDHASELAYFKGATDVNGFDFNSRTTPTANTTYIYDYFIAQ